MQGRRTIVAAASIVLTMSLLPNANATILYDTAGTYLINTTVNDDVLTDNSGVNVGVGSGGVIRGVAATSPSVFAAAIRTARGNLDVAGNGRIIAGPNQNAISMAGRGSVVRLREHASVTGDIVSPFTLPGYAGESTALGRLYVQDQAVVNGNLIMANFVRIQDQALIRGDVRAAGNATLTLDMRGGTATGALFLGGLDDHRVTMSGGSFLGGFRGAPSYVEMTMTGGYFGDGFRTIGNIDADISGGQIDGGISITQYAIGMSELDISGGIFDTYDGQWLLAFSDTHQAGASPLFSTLNISGGQFGYSNAGNGFFIDEWVNFSIFGWDLVYSNGWLTGYLEDGSWFNNQITFGNNWHGAFSIHNVFASRTVPEPGTWGMLAACLIGMGFARRRQA